MAAKPIRTFLSAIAVAATAFVAVPTMTAVPAQAGDYYHHGWGGPKVRHYHKHHHYHHRQHHRRHHSRGKHFDDGAAAAIIGLGALAIVGGAIASQNNTLPYTADPNYRARQRHHVRQPKVYTYAGSLEPWSPGWYEWCDNRYRSFNARTGTFRGYDGRDHFCVPR